MFGTHRGYLCFQSMASNSLPPNATVRPRRKISLPQGISEYDIALGRSIRHSFAIKEPEVQYTLHESDFESWVDSNVLQLAECFGSRGFRGFSSLARCSAVEISVNRFGSIGNEEQV